MAEPFNADPTAVELVTGDAERRVFAVEPMPDDLEELARAFFFMGTTRGCVWVLPGLGLYFIPRTELLRARSSGRMSKHDAILSTRYDISIVNPVS